MKQLQLLGTSACHLCEQAEALLTGCLAQGYPWEIEVIDIAEDDSLIAAWGDRIPVLCWPATGRALCWPFDAEAVVSFLAQPL